MRVKGTFTIYKRALINPARTADYAWRLTSGNGNIVAAASGYNSKGGATQSVRALCRLFGADVAGRDWKAKLLASHAIEVEVR